MVKKNLDMTCPKCGVKFIDTNIKIDDNHRKLFQKLLETNSCGELSISPKVLGGLEIGGDELYNFIFNELEISQDAGFTIELFLLDIKKTYKELSNYKEAFGISYKNTILIHPNSDCFLDIKDTKKRLNVFIDEEECLRLFLLKYKYINSLNYLYTIDNYFEECDPEKCKIIFKLFSNMSIRYMGYYYRFLEYLLYKYSLEKYSDHLDSISIDFERKEFVLIEEI